MPTVVPSCGTSPRPCSSTWSTRICDHAARTFFFQAASSRAPSYVELSSARRERRRDVELLDVVADHPGGEHLRAEFLDRVPEHLDPAAGDLAVVEARRDLLLDQVVQRVRLEVVTAVGVLDALGRRDRPAELVVVPLVPPAVADGQVERAVQRRLHPGRAARLVRAERVVQPDVAARVHRLRERDVVVGHEDDAVPDLGVVGEADHLLDQLLAALVGRVRLAGDHDLDRPGRVQQQSPSAARGRAASASAACTTGRGARSPSSARPGRGSSRPSRARPRWHRGSPRTRGPGRGCRR